MTARRRPARPVRAALAGALALLAVGWMVTGVSDAQVEMSEEDETCFGCHDDPTFVDESGVPRSLYVDPQRWLRSIHAENGCTSCHEEADPDDLPHPEEMSPVDCSGCHDDVSDVYAASTHGKAWKRGDVDAPRCDDCHSKHAILPSSDERSWTYVANVPRLCGACHREDSDMVGRHEINQHNVLTNYSMSIHGEGLFRRGLTVTAVCTSCHTAHNVQPHENAGSSINRANIATTCMQCHGQIEEVHRKVIRGELWEKQPHLIPACIDCHAPHQIRRVVYQDTLDDDYCMSCHSDRGLVRTVDGRVDSLWVDRATLLLSAHGARTPCVQCHVNVDVRNDPVCRDSGPVDCSICHAEPVADYQTSAHGTQHAAGNAEAPSCNDCHGTHDIKRLDDTSSPVFTRNIPDLCGKCHHQPVRPLPNGFEGDPDRVHSYEMGIHGKGLRDSGLLVTAVCSSCHLSHRELPVEDPESSVHPSNIATTCAQCHLGIYEEYRASIHSSAVSHSEDRLPVCNDCHRSHHIRRVDEDDFRQEILQQCGECHDDVAETYFDTYHGKVSLLGGGATAKCSDCHGSHNILPPEDPASTLSRHNVVETCGKCHPESNRKFTGYLTHATHHDRIKYPILFYAFWGMTVLLIGTFTFFGIHTLAWIPRSFRQRMQLNRLLGSVPERYVVRFEPFPRILHIIVIVSFLGLAVTGMVLKFAGQGWAVTLAQLLGGFESAGTIHRICAILTFSYFLLHFIYVRQKHRESGKRLWAFMFDKEGILPNRRDLVEFWQTLKWFFGMGQRPTYGRWTYWEKFDYFAVFWGVAVIGTTGLMLWFPTFFTKFLPGVLINVATIIHSDEALLATGFIFTVHFFNTHFRPEKFPMDPVIFTGVVPEEEFKHDRPREYELAVDQGKLESMRAGAPPSWLRRAGRIFGFCALAIGLTLIIVILWSALFQYR